MKKIATILLFFISINGGAQTFPTIDSLKNFIDRHIRNSAISAFTNLRLNTALKGIINNRGENVDTLALKGRIDSLVLAIYTHTINTSNPHYVTLSQVGYDSALDHGQIWTTLLSRVKYSDTATILNSYQAALLGRSLTNHTHSFTSLTGTVADNQLSTNIPLKNAANTFSSSQTFSNKIIQPTYEQENYLGDQYYTVTGTKKHIWRNTTTNIQAQLTETSDFEIMQNGKGIIFRSADGSRYKLTIPNGGGSITITAL